MTADDRRYMQDVDDPNLVAFLAWHRDATNRGVLQGMSWYSQLKMCWMAAKNSQRTPEYAPSRDILPPAPLEPLPVQMAYSPEGNRELADQEFQVDQPRLEAAARRYPMAGPDQLARIPGPHRTIDPDPFARVRLTGPQQAAMAKLYPDTATPRVWDGRGTGTRTDMPVVGPVESVEEHRRGLLRARFAGLQTHRARRDG